VKQLALDLENNEDKIIVHGKRAESIVKGMLQHSRSGLGQKESTDINSLTDEFLRLSYHGVRAKDKNFNVKLNTNYDLWIDKTEVVPQDLGRALLNIFNNAFYTVKKTKIARRVSTNCSAGTHKVDGGVEIRIEIWDGPDNTGDVFQLHFTTKPAGPGYGSACQWCMILKQTEVTSEWKPMKARAPSLSSV
jgi:nitrogen fixation/metabolism regulation signal transduction histidine kinase